MSKLFIIPTPIGNLEDITIRALRILKECDLILAEDTRKTSYLCKHFEISTKMMAHHKFNEHKSLTRIVEMIKSGTVMAMVSDAGTPSVSDPGFLIVRECIKNGIEVDCLPGATALIPALVNSGLPSEKFFFEGFLPHKKGRQTRLRFLATIENTMVLYESPYRLLKTLEQFIEHFGEERQASVSREISKLYEETKRGTLKELHDYYKNGVVKGEIVIVIAGK